MLLLVPSVLSYVLNLATYIHGLRVYLGTATSRVVLVSSAAISAAFCLFVLLKKQTIGARFGAPTKVNLYPRWARVTASGIFVLTVLTPIGALVYTHTTKKPFSIAITTIDGPTNYAVTEILTEQLHKAALKYPGLEITSLHKAIPLEEGAASARRCGREAGASVVIWGWYRTTTDATILTLHCELLSPEISGWTNATESGGIYPVRQFESFEVQRTLGSDVTSLILFFHAMSKLNSGDLAAAVSLTSDAIDHIPEAKTHTEDPFFYLTRGFAYSEMSGIQNHRYALDDFSQAVSLRPDLVFAYINRASAFLSLGMAKEALTDCDKALALVPNHSAALGNRAMALCNLGRYREALDDARAMDGRPPWFPLNKICLAQVLEASGKYAEALTECNVFLKFRPGEPAALQLRAQILKDLRRFEDAIRDLNHLIKVKEYQAAAYYDRGDVYMTKGDNEKALADFDSFLRMLPDSADGRVMRAQMHQKLGHHTDAIKDLDVAETLQTNLLRLPAAAIYSIRGGAYASLSNYAASYTNFSRALELNPNNSHTRIERALALYSLGLRTNALEDLSSCLSLNPSAYDRAEASFYRGNVYILLQRFSEAVDDFNTTLSLAPSNAAAYVYRGIAYFRQGDFTNALKDCERGLAVTNDPQTFNNATSLRAALKETGI